MVWVKRLSITFLGLLLVSAILAGIGLVAINTASGRDWVKGQIEGLEFENGLRIGIGSIDGSLYSAMTVREITLSDPQGVFANIPETNVDWSPFAILVGHVDIRSVGIETATLSRVPEFPETAPSDEPLLPDYAIVLEELSIKQIVIEERVAGSKQIASVAGGVRIEDRRAEITINAESVAVEPGAASGDVVRLVLAAVPEENRLDLDLDLQAPANGVIAAMAGFEGPFEAKLKGQGTWADWNGHLTANWLEQPLADLALTAGNGIFRASGETQLAGLAPDSLGNVLEGSSELEAELELGDASTRIDARLVGKAIRFEAAGNVAFSENRFDGLKAQVSIGGRAKLTSQVSGTDLEGTIVLDGELSRPNIAYDFRARRLAYADYGLEGFSTSGETPLDLAEMRLALNALADRVVGLDLATGGQLQNVRLTGDILIEWPRILSDNLRLQSPRLDAGITLVADAQAGRYGGLIEGRLGNYELQSVGLFDAASSAKFDIETRTGVALEGTIQARSTKIANDGLQSLLGGETAISSDVEYQRDGITRLSNMRLFSPLLEVSEGGGTYGVNGEFDIAAQGQSNDYGPLALQLTGTLSNPVAVIDAPSPDLGVGLANVTATVRGEDQLYRIETEGMSDFGAFSGTVLADFSQGPTTFEVASGELGGISLSGRITQTQAGTFAGDLDAQGRGLNAQVQLASEDDVQIARITAQARNMMLPGAAGLRIGSGRAKASATFKEQPEINADIEIARSRYFGTQIDTARAVIDLVDGQGTAKILATGENTVPFRLAANAELKPDMWRAAIDGTLRGIAIRSEAPARIIPASQSTGDHYELLPTRFAVGKGKVRLSGRFGPSLEVKSRIDTLDLAILNRFNPALGITGKATGSIDFRQDDPAAMPVAQADIRVAQFSRSTALTVSEPLDVRFAGRVNESEAVGRAIIRQGGDVLGRIHTDLSPLLVQDDDWVEALLEAPLSGGVRYTGSAGSVFSLAGLVGQEVDGALGIAADFSGSLVQPSLNGIIRARDLSYDNLTYGTRLTGLNAKGRFDGDELIIEQLEAKAGPGSVSAQGTISLAADQGFPMAIDVALDNARLASGRELGARATAKLTITKVAGERGLLAGTLTLPETRYLLRNAAALEVPELEGVRFAKEGEAPQDPAKATFAQNTEPGLEDLRLDLRLKAKNEVFVAGLGLQSEWAADLRVTGTSAAPRLGGEVDLVRGTLDFAGRAFDIERGQIRFLGRETFDPRISISASEQIREVAVTIDVEGSAFSPEFEFSSTPGLPQDEILARILFGNSIANLSALEAVQLAQSLNTLSGSGGGLNPIGSLRSAAGLDRLRLLAADEESGQGTALAAGQYISDDIYVEVITDARGFTATQLEISLSRALSVLSQAGGAGGTNVNLRYRKDY
ncbi:MAG: translocation/assembly module TamB domain-containing protein [Pseudomonadota bacterium]